MEIRGILGGICLVLGGIPLALFYGFDSFGYLGIVLILIGALISYGAYAVE